MTSGIESHLKDLSKFHNRLEIVKQAGDQLVKDFEMEGLKIEFSGDPLTCYEELYKQVIEIVAFLLDQRIERFMQLLYRIDINEKQLKQILEQGNSDRVHADVTKLILERELKKVIIRNFYNGTL